MAGELKLTEAEISIVAAAVEAAEARTSAEFVVLTAGEVSDYRWIPLAWATAAALLVPLLLAVTLLPLENLVEPGWGTGEPPSPRATIGAYAVLQALTFLVVGAVASIPTVRRRLTPRVARRNRVRRAAVEHFLARDLHHTRERNAVLIYVALLDRDVEVVADEGALAAVPQSTWDAAASAVARACRQGRAGEGLAGAVTDLGEALAARFPRRADDRNELPDAPVAV